MLAVCVGALSVGALMRWSSLLYFFSREGECTNNNKFTRDYDDLYTRSQFLAASSWSAGALRGSSERCELCARWELCVRCVRALYTFPTRGGAVQTIISLSEIMMIGTRLVSGRWCLSQV